MTRPFLLAVFSCLGLGAAFYGSVYAFTSDVHLSEGLGALPLIAIHGLAEGIERRSAGAKQSNVYAANYSFGKYMVSWYWIVLIGAATIVAFANLISLFGGFVAGAAQSAGDPQKMSMILSGVMLIPTLAFAYALGRWTGVRSYRGGWILVIAYTILGTVLVHGIDYLYTSDAVFQQMFGGHGKGLPFLADQILTGSLLFGLPGLVGFWRGRHAQQGAYVAHLLRLLPRETRDVVTSMIVDEVSRLPATPLKPAPGAAVAGLGAQAT
jgi:hypothetical protein